ncbi:MAG TPA: SPOR domain-containing protein [Bacteroidota bacterium]|nr:SPOR domain-containing protein [Bacteroidota bacterium]
MHMKRIVTVLSVCASIAVGQAVRSSEPDIQRRLEMIERGQTEVVKAELPTLMTNYQNHPGVLYLQAVLTSDGSEAAKIYQSIVDNFPKSEWGDDALYKLYQYYYSIGLYKTADQKLEQLKQNYPFSAYAAEYQSVRSQEKIQEAPAIISKPGTVDKFATSFTVQVGAFSTLQNAEDLRAKFEREGYASNIFTILTDGKKLHKVWVGEFQSYDEAKRFTSEIKKNFNLESIVVSR